MGWLPWCVDLSQHQSLRVGFQSPRTCRLFSSRMSSAMLVRDRQSNSGERWLRPHDRQESHRMRLVTAAFAFIPSPFGKLGSGAAEKPGQLPARRFPPPRSVEELDACFVVIDSARQKQAYVYFEDEPGGFNTTARS